jgi:hypothetical protein
MGSGRSRGTLVLPAAAAAIVALSLLARNFWVLGYFSPPGRPYTGEAAYSPSVDECADCHQEVGALHDRGPHHSITCEDCHGPAREHVKGGEKAASMPPSKSIARLCSTCHREMNARTESAPKLNFEAHVVETGALFSDRICLDCHRPHDPRP